MLFAVRHEIRTGKNFVQFCIQNLRPCLPQPGLLLLKRLLNAQTLVIWHLLDGLEHRADLGLPLL